MNIFNNQELSVGAWLVFWILMAIPLVNVIMFLIILFSKDSNKTLKNMLVAMIVNVVIWVLLFWTVLSSVWILIWETIQGYLPQQLKTQVVIMFLGFAKPISHLSIGTEVMFGCVQKMAIISLFKRQNECVQRCLKQSN